MKWAGSNKVFLSNSFQNREHNVLANIQFIIKLLSIFDISGQNDQHHHDHHHQPSEKIFGFQKNEHVNTIIQMAYNWILEDDNSRFGIEAIVKVVSKVLANLLH